MVPRMRYAGSRRLPAPPHIHLRPSQLAPLLAPPLSRSSDVVPGLGERVARLVSARRRGHAPLVLLVRVKVRVAVRVEGRVKVRVRVVGIIGVGKGQGQGQG